MFIYKFKIQVAVNFCLQQVNQLEAWYVWNDADIRVWCWKINFTVGMVADE